jgi:dihydrofolate reductase
MKVILYMATTINGFIAKENDDTSFVSKRDWKSFLAMVKKMGHVVIGRRTYEVTSPSEFVKSSLYVVVTHKKDLRKKTQKIIFTDKSPKNIVKMLNNMGFRKVLIAGGGNLNSAFMKTKLIDEIYLDVEPFTLGKGIRLFAEADFEAKLKLIGTKKISANEIQLHYKVLK